MKNEHWLEYTKHCFDLIVESEGRNNLILSQEVEAYVVHLMARNFNRNNIGINPIAIQLMSAISNKANRENLLMVADECLLIQSFPLAQHRWPTKTYYADMGIVAYGLAEHIMEKNFNAASKVLNGVFNYRLENFLK